MMETQGTVTFEIKDYIGQVLIDHLPANSLNRATLGALGSVMESLNANDSVRVIIITGRGRKFFAGGADINEFLELTQETGKTWIEAWGNVFGKIHYSPKIVIAAVNGYALGGGAELALACDLRVAAENAKFGQPEVKYGIIPGAGATQRLTRLIGAGRAKELIFTGGIISAQEALQMGLVNRVVPAEKLADEARMLAEKILSNGPVAVRLAKEAINAAWELPLTEGLKREMELFTATCETEDKNEGSRAFLEKRSPQFRGK